MVHEFSQHSTNTRWICILSWLLCSYMNCCSTNSKQNIHINASVYDPMIYNQEQLFSHLSWKRGHLEKRCYNENKFSHIRKGGFLLFGVTPKGIQLLSQARLKSAFTYMEAFPSVLGSEEVEKYTTVPLKLSSPLKTNLFSTFRLRFKAARLKGILEDFKCISWGAFSSTNWSI